MGGHRSDAALITLENVTRTYSRGADEVEAVRGVSGEIRSGEIVTYLGPNGAGKTTLIKMIATLLTPTDGRILFRGMDVTTHYRHVRARMSLVLGGDRGFYMRASATDILRFFAELQGVPGGSVISGSPMLWRWSGSASGARTGSSSSRAECGNACTSPVRSCVNRS